MRMITALAAVLALWAAPVAAQGTRVAGKVTELSQERLALASEAGPKAFALDAGSAVIEVTRGSAQSIPAGAYLGIGASPQQADGTYKAVQIVVFAESMRGAGDGHRDWSVVPSGTMTNAQMTAAVTAADGSRVTLSTGGRSFDFTVPDDAKIIVMTDRQRDSLAVGMPVVVAPRQGSEAAPIAGRVFIGKAGEPPAF